jgi:single-stranded DNA-binding protein
VTSQSNVPPEINTVVVSGRVVTRKGLSRTSFGAWLLKFSLENSITLPGETPDQTRRKTAIISVQAWGESARKLDRQLKKGSFVIVEGRLSSISYEDRRKVIHHRMELTASDVQILDAPD